MNNFKHAAFRFLFGGHRGYTILIVTLFLFISVCVYFVNAVVVTPGHDDAYREKADANASLVNFPKASLNQAKLFTAQSNNTALPAGRTNPFAP